jgi:nicotinamidase-related amidase
VDVDLNLVPTKCALVMVECQGGVVGAQSTLPALAADAGPMLAALGRLAAAGRDAGATIVHLLYSPIAGNRSSNRRSVLFSRLLGTQDDWREGAPETMPVPEIGVGSDDLLLTRHSGLSPTYGTETFKILRNLGIDTIVLGGVSTNIALPAVAVEAVDEDFRVVVPGDATAGTPASHHESMLRHTLPFVATMATADEIITSWRDS